MDRRNFIAVIASILVATPRPVRAQPTGKVRRIGLLMVEAFGTDQRRDIQAALLERGWIEGEARKYREVMRRRFAQWSEVIHPGFAGQ